MDNSLLTLKLILDELGIKNNITSVDDRKTIQKAVYLAQRTGVDLGYRFSWYLMGPYSPRLTRDYYRLAAEQEAKAAKSDNRRLRADARAQVSRIKPVMTTKLSMSQDDWLELLASYHYLRDVRKESDQQAAVTIKKCKPRLYQRLPAAKEALKSVGLL